MQIPQYREIPLDRASLYWALGVFALGVYAIVRATALAQVMKNLNVPSRNWWLSKGYSQQQLEKDMVLYARLFGIVWILCGVFWIYWVLYLSKSYL